MGGEVEEQNFPPAELFLGFGTTSTYRKLNGS